MINLALVFSQVTYASFIQEPIERSLSKSDLIVVGSVTNIYTETADNKNIFRYTTIAVEEIIVNKTAEGRESILVWSFEGKENQYEVNGIQLNDARPQFKVGQHVLLLLLLHDNGYYEVTQSFRGKLDIVNGMIDGTNTSLEEFKTAIIDLINGKTSQFEAEMPSEEFQRNGVLASLFQSTHGMKLKECFVKLCF